ncbi:MAG: YicC/YloC family endoribonuclease [Deltaproteobacteria bacterium]
MRSMTGFGRARAAVSGGFITVEVRSINSRFLEVKLSLPREHQLQEPELRKRVGVWVERGRVDIAIRREAPERRRRAIEIDSELARETRKAWMKVARDLGVPGEVDLALLRQTAPDIVRLAEKPLSPKGEEPAVAKALELALKAHDRDRRREGKHLATDMRGRVGALDGHRRAMQKVAAEMKPIFQQRLEKRLAKVLGKNLPEPDRLVAEVAMALDKADVTEEMTRLAAHLDAFRGLLKGKAAVGKRIEFLLQEVLREVNTTGSKANHLALTQIVIDAKAELEKLREQAANIE